MGSWLPTWLVRYGGRWRVAPSVTTHKYRYIKRRLFPRSGVARRCHGLSHDASSRLATRKNPSVLFVPPFVCRDTRNAPEIKSLACKSMRRNFRPIHSPSNTTDTDGKSSPTNRDKIFSRSKKMKLDSPPRRIVFARCELAPQGTKNTTLRPILPISGDAYHA